MRQEVAQGQGESRAWVHEVVRNRGLGAGALSTEHKNEGDGGFWHTNLRWEAAGEGQGQWLMARAWLP